MEATKYGTKNLLPLFMLACELGNVGDQMGRTKGAGKYMLLVDLFDEVKGLGNVDFKLVKEELKDLDAQERAELHAAVKAKFDIVDDQLENVIEEGLGIIADLASGVERAIALVKTLKAK